METYRLSSKVQQRDHEYLIRTTNDAESGTVSTSIYIDGIQTETSNVPLASDTEPNQVLSAVKETHTRKRKELEELLQVIERTVTEGNSETLFHLGAGCLYRGFLEEAAHLLESAVRVDPNYHQALNDQGQVYLQMGRIEQAVQAATNATELRPGFADYRNNLGEALLANNALEQSVAEFEQAISINMYYLDAYLNLAMAHAQRAVIGSDRSTKDEAARKFGDCVKKLSMLVTDTQDVEVIKVTLQALEKGNIENGLKFLKSLRVDRQERRRHERVVHHSTCVVDPNWDNEDILSERIGILEAEVRKNPSFVDLQSELGQLYLRKSSLIWSKGVRQLEVTLGLNRTLKPAEVALEEAMKVQESMNQSLAVIMSGKDK